MHEKPTRDREPALPASLQPLAELAYNLRWTWDDATRRLFARLADGNATGESPNPVDTLRALTPERIEQLLADDDFIAQVDDAHRALTAYLAGTSKWFDEPGFDRQSPLAAYFSAEFGLTEHLPIYSGGLGVLAGDHLKSASALGLPLVAVGLFYYDGYFRQTIDPEGWQQDADVKSDPARLPMRLVRDPSGAPVTITVEVLDRTIRAQIWRVDVGRVPLYLMDTRLPENAPEDRAISSRLYGGDQDLRLRQEIILGIGGYRTLDALGIQPVVYHLNEGHSSFLSLERIHRMMKLTGASFVEALASVRETTLFTTHTPVAAGHDYFPAEMLRPYFADTAANLGLEWEDLLSLGRVDAGDSAAPFGMTELAMRTSAARNGVSKLHGEVTREMWHKLWPEVSVEDVPVGHITNGVHMATWIAPEIAALVDRQVGPDWRHRPTTFDEWSTLQDLPDNELWQTHQGQKSRLVADTRRRLQRQAERQRGGQPRAAAQALDPEALTIGFARRFTAYKRATLLLSDLDRLEALIESNDRPVQFIFAGKAHPRDMPGKQLIQRIASIAQREPFKGRMIFLEGYDMAIARLMVAGVDVWLNNPIRPQEASGTSGMKAAANGALNFSVLDGWWAEAWETAMERGEPIGWAIDPGHEYEDPAERDAADAIRLYEVLEQEIIPTFYDRDNSGVPSEWVRRMKASMRCAVPDFSGLRMVSEYTRRYYLPAAAQSRRESPR